MNHVQTPMHCFEVAKDAEDGRRPPLLTPRGSLESRAALNWDMSDRVMLPDDSMADTVASMNYRWTKDSWISQNHPTVEHSADRSTFIRGLLDTAKKQEVRRLAKLLDDCGSPEQRRLPARDDDKKPSISFLPQACSSPKSDSYMLQSERIHNQSTPAMTHRSMSPTPTNTSISWQRHSMKQTSRDSTRSAIPSGASLTTSGPRESKMMRRVVAPNDSDTNYRPTQVSQIEDSYWRPEAHSYSMRQHEITPSPIKLKEEYYTAKQFPATTDVAVTVESLRIASPVLQQQQSPSVRKAYSLASLPLENDHADPERSQGRDVSRADALEQTKLDSTALPIGNRTDLATLGDLSECQSDHGSELSKVDSQATSLQQAISMALQENKTASAGQPSLGNLTLEEAIAARFRESLASAHGGRAHQQREADHSHVSLPSKAPELAHSVEGRARKHTPLQETGSRRQIDFRETSQAASELDHSRVVEMLVTLEQVTEECSRRGRLIEEMTERLASTGEADLSVQQALHDAEERSKTLEDQMLAYKLQVDQMSQDLQSMRIRRPQEAPQPHSAFPSTEDEEHNNGPRSFEIQNTSTPKVRNQPLPNAFVKDGEESLADKVQRWEESVGAASEAGIASVDDAVARAQILLSKDPSRLLRDSARHTFLNKSREGVSQTGITSELMTPRAAQVSLSPRPVPETSYHGASIRSGDKTNAQLLEALQSAEAEIEHLRHSQSREPRIHSQIRPLTADMMPDARDFHKLPQERLYHRLQLARIDEMQKVELENLVKNILIQLDVPYDQVSSRVTALALQLTVDEKNQDVLWHEATKLREFAESIHATLYQGDHIEGSITSTRCLRNMNHRVEKLQRALYRSRERAS